MSFFFEKIAYEGRKRVLISLILSLLCLFCDFSLFFLILFIFFIYLYYIPENRIKSFEKNAIYTPVEGEIIEIEKNLIQIYTGIFDRSILKSPIDGKIVEKNFIHGVFLDSDLEKSKKLNENFSFVLEGETCKIEVSSLSDKFGFLGHSFYKNKNQEIKIGDNIGFCANSIVTIQLPENSDIRVFRGQKLEANEILAFLKEKSE